jgi:FAD/FMN-containing dehydrogenase
MPVSSQLSRRAMLAGSAASLALPSFPRGSRAQSQPSDAAWRELDKRMKRGVIRPNDPRFTRLTLPENLRYYNPPAQPGNGPPDPDAPFGLVRPVSSEEVAYAIQWSIDNKLPMVPRSGGHSYAGCSTVPGLVISSSSMQSVNVEEGLVVADGGALFAHLLDRLRHIRADSEAGRYTTTHGRCAGVGLSAYLMGGGWALDSVHAGMGCDRVAQVEIVLAAGGPPVRVTANDPDPWRRELFWAVCGGGGGNLGFATKWWLRPIIRDDKLTAFSGSWRLAGNAHLVFQKLLRALDAAPDTMGSEITISTTSATIKSPWRYQINLSCQLHGPRDQFHAILGRALAEAAGAEQQDCWFENCSSTDTQELPYWDAQEFFEVIGSPNRYQETSLFADKISDEFIGAFFGVWPSWPGTALAARMTCYRTGGKVNTIRSDATAFVHRSSRWIVTTDIDWSGGDSQQVVDDNLKWQRDVQNHFSAMLGNPGSYYNFPDPGLKNPAQAYWGSNLERLTRIKRQVDPQGVFSPPRNQGILARA